MPLSQRFFLVTLLVVLASVVAFGGSTGAYVSGSIVKGIGETAASSITALVRGPLEGALSGGPSADEEREDLEAAFNIASGVDGTSLLLLRLRRLDGTLVLQIGNDLRDETSEADELAAADGRVSVRLTNVVVPGVAGLPSSPLPVLKIYAPQTSSDGKVIGALELLFGARAIATLQSQARTASWIISMLVGFVALGVVALIVDVTGRVIDAHRLRLARNLSRTRALLRENVVLQQTSNLLRLESILANERVLNEVGSGIHDGPVQLLTLLILRMPGGEKDAEVNRGLAQQSMEELRAISSGLILPEITAMSLADAIEAAIERHQNLTGGSVDKAIDVSPSASASVAARVCAYRVIQEALTNAVRHGGSSVPQVVVRLDGRWVEIVVSNPLTDGASIASPNGRLGLRGMRFRVESLGGQLRLHATEGRAVLEARFPIDEQPWLSRLV